jgi:hypothetical protein
MIHGVDPEHSTRDPVIGKWKMTRNSWKAKISTLVLATYQPKVSWSAMLNFSRGKESLLSAGDKLLKIGGKDSYCLRSCI